MVENKDSKYVCIDGQWKKLTVKKLKADKVSRYYMSENGEKQYLTDQEMQELYRKGNIKYE